MARWSCAQTLPCVTRQTPLPTCAEHAVSFVMLRWRQPECPISQVVRFADALRLPGSGPLVTTARIASTAPPPGGCLTPRLIYASEVGCEMQFCCSGPGCGYHSNHACGAHECNQRSPGCVWVELEPGWYCQQVQSFPRGYNLLLLLNMLLLLLYVVSVPAMATLL